MRVRETMAASVAAALILAGWTLAQGIGLGEVKSCGTLVEWPTGDENNITPLDAGSPVSNESTLEARSGAATIDFEGGQKLQMMQGAQVSVLREEKDIEEEGTRRKANVWSFKVERGVGIIDAHDDEMTMTELAVHPGTLHFGGTRVRAESGTQGNVKLSKVTMETGSGILELISKKGRLVLPDETIILARIDAEKFVMTIKVLRGPIVYRRSEKEIGVRCETGKVLVLDLTPAVRPKRWSGMLLSMAPPSRAFGPATPEAGESGDVDTYPEEPYYDGE